MIISDKHQFAFIHIPKSAGSTVRHALMSLDERREQYYDRSRAEHPVLGALDHAHIPLAVLAEHFSADLALLREYRAYALLRDPLTRFESSLHEYVRTRTGGLLADLSPVEQRSNIATVLDLLGQHGNAPVTNPALIHFARQSDYIELDGERIVDGLYLLEHVGQMLDDIEERVGEPLPRKDRNRRVEYSSPILASASGAVQRGLRRLLPASVTGPMFGLAKRGLLATGAASTLKSSAPEALPDAEIEAFVREFYARDFVLRNEVKQAGPPTN
ncbi:sulfotransferase family 2 domain-containing protein [Aurantiacibacter gilvus]|uniref:Sulfotransferase family 2 domain-containing protein n=1 Tax=Aurantiacibacter gilvus TaxID=3139141 RepID=A0ABU9ICC7_9SPHN